MTVPRSDRTGLVGALAGHLPAWLLALVTLVVAALARFVRIQQAYEIHVDEPTYASFARSIASGEGLVLNDTPFHLHPPGAGVLMALVIRATGPAPDMVELIARLRLFEAAVGTLTCVVVALLVRRLAGPVLGLLAGLSLALDPFTNRWDSRVFLEAPAVMFTAAAASCLAAVAAQERPRGRLLVGAGLAVGAAVLCKETYALVTVLPVLVLVVLRLALRRRDGITVVGVAAACYVGYVISIVLAGDWPDWWREKLVGVQRLLGLRQESGFNAPHAEPLTSQLWDNLVHYGPSYALVGAGALGAVVLGAVALRGRSDPSRRAATGPLLVLASWQLCADAYLAYAVPFGTLEEQMFCLLLSPAVVVLAVLLGQLRSRPPAVQVAAAAAACLLVLTQLGSTVLLRTSTDDGYRRLAAWTAAKVPAGTRMSVTEVTAQFLLRDVDLNAAGTLPAITGEQSDLVVVSTQIARRGYGEASTETIDQLDRQGRLVFCFSGKTLGQLRVYDVRSLTGGSGRTAGADWPTATCP